MSLQDHATDVRIGLILLKKSESRQNQKFLAPYAGQRRAATVEQVQAMSIRDKRMMEERDPAVQRARLQEMIAIAADPVRAKQHRLNISMISGLRRAAQVQ